MYNSHFLGNSLTVCRAERSCCTVDMESNLKTLVKKEYQDLLEHNVQSVQGVLASTATHFRGKESGFIIEYLPSVHIFPRPLTSRLFFVSLFRLKV